MTEEIKKLTEQEKKKVFWGVANQVTIPAKHQDKRNQKTQTDLVLDALAYRLEQVKKDLPQSKDHHKEDPSR